MTSSATRRQLALGVQPQVGGDLVVAAAPGVELGPDVAGQLGDPALDGGVDVLVVGLEDEACPPSSSSSTRSRAARSIGHLVVGEEAAPAEAPHVGPRAGQVVAGQAPVEGEADGEGHHLIRRSRRGGRPRGSRGSPRRRRHRPRPLLAAAQVATPRPHSRTKPSASWWRKVSVAS